MLDTKEMVTSAALDAPGGPARRIGHYELRRELGRGGMSVVYEAWDTRTGLVIALKLLSLPPTLAAAESDALVARFEREARTVVRISHPNVISIHEIGRVQGQHFIAMEFLRGQTLRQRMTRHTLSIRESYSVLLQIAGALDAVHAAGIVHRDVKASNVMLLPDGTAKLLDFGIARSCEEAEITSTGAILGTPSYMAPEQVRGEPATEATDLWALGVLSYELLTGHLPFAGQVTANVLYQVLNSPPAPAPNLPKSVQKVLRRALDKDPAHRYPSAYALTEALGAALPKSFVPPPSAPNLGAEKSRSVPRWAQGTALFLLFLGAFSYTVLHRHQTLSAQTLNARTLSATKKTAMQQPVSSPAAGEATPPAGVPVSNVLPEEPTRLPMPSSLPQAASLPQAPTMSQAPAAVSQEPITHQESVTNQESAPRPSEQPAVQGDENLPPERQTRDQVNGSNVNESAALPQPEAAPLPQSSAPPTAAAVPPPSDPVRPRAVRPVSAPDPKQSVTLPAGSDSDDPEAEARLRKSAWSQSSSPIAP